FIVLALLYYVVWRISNHHHNLRVFLALDAFGVLLHEHGYLSAFSQFESISKTGALKRLILAHPRVVFVLNIKRGDIIRQQHDLVAEEVMFILVFKSVVGYTVQEVHDVAASANARVNDLDAWLFD